MLEDLLYPDNRARAGRAATLANDCELLASELLTVKPKVDQALAAATEAYRAALKSCNAAPAPHVDVRISQGWLIKVPGPISGLVTGVLVDQALATAYTRYLLAQGRIGEAAFARVTGLPRWFRLGKFAGSVVSALAVTVVVQLGIDAVDGAVQRSALRDAISSMATPRFRLRRAVMINNELLGLLSGLTVAYDTFADSVKSMNLDAAMSEQMIANFSKAAVDKAKAKLAGYTNDVVVNALAQADRDRSAWTTEDAAPDTAAEQPTVESAVMAALMLDRPHGEYRLDIVGDPVVSVA